MSITNSQATVLITATKLFSANGDRLSYSIINLSTGSIFIGKNDSVTITTGSELPTGSARNVAGDSEEVWAIAGSSLAISLVEQFRRL